MTHNEAEAKMKKDIITESTAEEPIDLTGGFKPKIDYIKDGLVPKSKINLEPKPDLEKHAAQSVDMAEPIDLTAGFVLKKPAVEAEPVPLAAKIEEIRGDEPVSLEPLPSSERVEPPKWWSRLMDVRGKQDTEKQNKELERQYKSNGQ